MRLASLLCSALLVTLPLAASPAHGQSLVSEAVQGNHRLCTYGGDNGLLSGTVTGRLYQVGLAENCPLTFPVETGGLAPPPTAALSSESLTAEGRVCVYERWGSRWSFALRDQSACPPVAGMVTRSQPRVSELPPSPARIR